MKTNRVVVVIKTQKPTEEDLKAVSGLKERAAFVWGGKHFKCTNSERINCKYLLNLTDRKDIDEFYSKELVTLKDLTGVSSEPEPKATPEPAKEEAPKEEAKPTPAKKTTRKTTTTKATTKNKE